MKVSLEGLISQAQSACKKGDKKYGNLYAYSLGEMLDNLKLVASGEATFEEFAILYCLKKKKEENPA